MSQLINEQAVIDNQRTRQVKINLIHPDSSSQFAFWTIDSSSMTRLEYNYQPTYFGDDWGIQIGNGCIFYLREVGIYNSQTYTITLSDPDTISLSGLESPYSPRRPLKALVKALGLDIKHTSRG